jgi:Phosphoenolpyruvate phosphomutase
LSRSVIRYSAAATEHWGKRIDWTDRRERLCGVIAGGPCIYPGSLFDRSRRIADDLGFEAGMSAGSIASFTVLGAPDIVTLTLTKFAQQAYRINRAGKLPLPVDADHGYGNALNVKRTVEELETAGVAAMTIEGTLLPTPYGDGRRTFSMRPSREVDPKGLDWEAATRHIAASTRHQARRPALMGLVPML